MTPGETVVLVARERFTTPSGVRVPAVTAAETRDVDRVAVEDVGVQLLQMMENAGRTLAVHVAAPERAVIAAGPAATAGAGWPVPDTSRTATFEWPSSSTGRPRR